jgi:NADPH:quinone reductase-like Zn-dependent oxidoreductase
VIALTGAALGGHSTLVTTDEDLVVQKPEQVDHPAACAFPIVFMTMHHVFRVADIGPGDRILIQTATGGAGLIAVQLAVHRRAEVLATAGSPEKLDHLRRMGVAHPINYRTEDFEQRVMALTEGRGVDVVINTLSGVAIQKGINVLAPGGRYVEIAMTGLRTSDGFDLSSMTDNQMWISVDLSRLLARQPDRVRRYLDAMVNHLKADTIRPTIAATFPFSKIKEAYAHLKNRGNIGKVVVTTDGNPSRASDIPVPVSVTYTVTSLSSRTDLMISVLLSSVESGWLLFSSMASMALDTRLMKTCSRRLCSAIISGSSGFKSSVTSIS